MTTEITVLDIETTGLTATSELVCFTLGHQQVMREPGESEQSILKLLSEAINQCKDNLLVTFAGAPKFGSFKGLDIPFLRNRYIQNGMIDRYPFVGMDHLDVSDMAVKHLITATEEDPKIDDLTADLVIRLAHIIGIVPTKTKKTNVAMLEEVTNPEMLDKMKSFMCVHGESKLRDHKSLDSICLHVFNNFGEDLTDHIVGADVPQIWKRYCETNDAGCRTQILDHNCIDVRKTYMLFRALEKLTSYRPITTL
ncbi:hypothetical protein E4H12_08485 [Candidatus Thorarchaeota archaeon]|nr:MAG: hypothetical protein E4H12_08485 [Candidatus Thorarchaeota archaeon]